MRGAKGTGEPGKQIRVSQTVVDHLNKNVKSVEDSYDSVLKRLLGLDKPAPKARSK